MTCFSACRAVARLNVITSNSPSAAAIFDLRSSNWLVTNPSRVSPSARLRHLCERIGHNPLRISRWNFSSRSMLARRAARSVRICESRSSSDLMSAAAFDFDEASSSNALFFLKLSRNLPNRSSMSVIRVESVRASATRSRKSPRFASRTSCAATFGSSSTHSLRIFCRAANSFVKRSRSDLSLTSSPSFLV